MTDFPVLDGFTTNSNSNVNLSSDPTADFLAREQALLGEDAAIFAAAPTSTNSSTVVTELEGFPEISTVATISPATLPVTTSFTSPTPDYSAFHNEFPPVELATSSIPTIPPSFDGTSGLSQVTIEEEQENEVLREWRERQQELIAERDDASEQKKQETVKQAHDEIDKFYSEYNEKKAIAQQHNRKEEELFIQERDDITSGTSWERICKILNLVNTQSKSNNKHEKDVSRFKELLLDLKKDEKAPGAGGY
ncbi:3178_t:CDS:2 [Ambispora gerdemannii]|uniref:Clathrin light chain n=1 Tax=Ambispora gerdemannii TaxID=144530 RepID=A0A9N9BQ70_9GLOM|nr:3178_t:CDS:2 [Ambispora gerdemannii]